MKRIIIDANEIMVKLKNWLTKKKVIYIIYFLIALSFVVIYLGYSVGTFVMLPILPLVIVYYVIHKEFIPYVFLFWVFLLPFFIVFQWGGIDILRMEKNFYLIITIVFLMIIGTVLLQLKLIKRIESKEIQKKAFRKTLNYGCFLLLVYLITYFFLHFINSRFPSI